MIALTHHARGTVLSIKAQPGARRSGILGERAGALRVAVTAPPERGRANEAIADLLAEVLNVKGSRVSLVVGQTSRDKRFLIEEMTPADLQARLGVLLGADHTPIS